MSFLAPERLGLLALLLVLIVAYVVLQVRRTRYAVRFTDLALLDKVAPRHPGWRRHLPAAAFLLTVGLLTLAFARPTAPVDVPRERATVLLVIDVSTSMQATDVSPSRIEAAREAAKKFVAELPAAYNVSLVTFAGTASQVVAPTTDRTALYRGLETMQLAPRTAIGEGVFTALDGLRAFSGAPPAGSLSSGGLPAAPLDIPARIVLLSDGENTVGRAPLTAAEAAKEAGVPLSTIAYGTDTGSVVVDGDIIPVPADGGTLKAMAKATGGSFYEAASGDELQQVYEDIGSSVETRQEQREISTWFVGAALVGAMLSAAMSLLWFSRLP